MTTTSKEYAQALFELSSEAERTEETLDGLNLIREELGKAPEYKAMLASPAIGKEERLKAVDQAFRGRIPDILLGVLRMMVSRGHVSSYPLEVWGLNKVVPYNSACHTTCHIRFSW